MKKKNTLASAQVKENLNSGTKWKKAGTVRAVLQFNDMPCKRYALLLLYFAPLF